MPYRQGTFVQGQFYHIFNRVLANELLFASEDEYVLGLRLLRRYAERYAMSVVAYCLLPTHYHMVLRPVGEADLSACIRTLFNAYVQTVNKQRPRRGPLFQGRFRHRPIEDDAYLLQVCRYIHLNPVKAGLVAAPED